MVCSSVTSFLATLLGYNARKPATWGLRESTLLPAPFSKGYEELSAHGDICLPVMIGGDPGADGHFPRGNKELEGSRPGILPRKQRQDAQA